MQCAVAPNGQFRSNLLRMNPIVDRMYNEDYFSQWLGIQRLEEEPGFCILQLEVRPEMTNGFGIAHGAITYALADSALAFASNSHGRKAVSIETSINHIKPCLLYTSDAADERS